MATNDPLIGQLIEGKYAVDKLIGAGGMGKVYAGRNVRTESPVAIKTLIPELVKDESLVKRFEIEAKAASNLHHPNTIRIYDYGEFNGCLFMVMELLNGSSLEGTLRAEKHIEPRRLLRIMKQVCRSLAEAHGMGLVHRDLKPDNIFLNRAGGEEDFVKVLDFGVAKLKDNRYGQATLTQAGMIFGTPTYMSPEQARAFDIDGRSDIYALGVILYECLTGKAPFEANDPVAVLIQHVQEPPPPFRERNPSTPDMPEFEAIAMRCLRKKPDERYQSVSELLQALEEVERLYASGATTGNLPLSGGATVSLNQNTHLNQVPDPTQIGSKGRNPDWAERLGVDKATSPNYQLGGNNTQFGDSPDPTPRSPMRVVLGVLVGMVILAGVGLFFLLQTPTAPSAGDIDAGAALQGGSDTTAAVPTESSADNTAAEASAATAAAEQEATELAALRFDAALTAVRPVIDRARTAGTDAVEAAVIHFRIEETNGVAATVTIDGEAPPVTPMTLPLQFARVAQPTAPPTEITFVIEAEGYATRRLTVPLVDADVHPVELTRPRPQNNGNGNSNHGNSGRNNGGNGGPLANPYGN